MIIILSIALIVMGLVCIDLSHQLKECKGSRNDEFRRGDE